MLRRLCTLLLMLACAFAPVLPALESVAKADDCCCHKGCCAPTDCALPPAPTHSTTTLTVVGAVEARAPLARPAAMRAAFVRAFVFDQKVSDQPGSALIARRAIEVAASAPLYRAHCTLLL